MREAEEPVYESVLLAHHPAHHALEGVERRDVGDELEALAGVACPRHGAAHQESSGVETLLLGPLDVRRLRSLLELVVGVGVAADDVVALARRHAMEAVEIVDPALDGGEARAV